jgi:hypothetical protein
VSEVATAPAPSGIAPLLKDLLPQHASTGLPSADIPFGREPAAASPPPDDNDFDEKDLF